MKRLKAIKHTRASAKSRLARSSNPAQWSSRQCRDRRRTARTNSPPPTTRRTRRGPSTTAPCRCSTRRWAERARGNVGWRFAICYGAFSVLLVAAHAGQKAGLVEPPVEEATHQQELEASVADFEESLSKDSIKKDDAEA